MQAELTAQDTRLQIVLLGCNYWGALTDRELMTANRTIPLLQDTQTENAWGRMGAQQDWVVILDENNHRIGTFDHDLSVESNRSLLRQMLIQAANEGGP